MEKMVRNNDLNAAIDTLLKNNKGIVETESVPSVTESVTQTTLDEEFKYTKEDICNLCEVSASSFDRFVALSPVTERDFIALGSNHKKFYNEKILKEFQLWLMKNQINQGTQVSTVKSTVETAFQSGLTVQELIKSGNTAALDEYIEVIRDAAATHRDLMAEQQKNKEYQEKMLELQPKADFADRISSSETLLTISAVCKVLGLKYGCVTLYKHLVKLGVLNQNHIPYQEYISRGYFKVCEGEMEDSYENVHVTLTTKVYQKGVNFIMKLLQKNNLFDTVQ